MKTKMYLHSNKDSNYELGEKLGLKDDALRRFAYALSEVEFEVGVDPGNGDVTVLMVNGKAVSQEYAERKVFVQDEDFHWYMIPADQYKLFSELERGDCELFNDKFHQYRSSAPHCYGVLDPTEIS